LDFNQLTESARRDVQALVAANEVAHRSVEALVRRQVELLAQTIAQRQNDTWDLFTGKTAAQTASHQVDQAQEVLGQVISNAREMADAVSKSQVEMASIVKRRIQEGMEDL
jgi:phasin family protein